MKRRTFVRACIAMAAATSSVAPALAQDPAFPTKPIRLIVSTSPGTMTDGVSRLYGERLAKILKQPVVVENMPGASTLLASRHVVKADPDGHTLLVAANTVVTMPHLVKNAGYTTKDLVGISELARSPSLLVVSASSSIKSLKDLVAEAKKRPGDVTYGFTGHGTTSHLTAELFATNAGVKFHSIPYKGISLAIPDVVTGRVTFMMGPSTSVSELIKSGKMRALGVTADARLPAYPDVPTFKEMGYPGVTYSLFIGLLAPAGTPAPIQAAIANAIEATKKDPALLERLNGYGQEISDVRTPEQFRKFLILEEEKSQKLFKEANISIES